MTVNIFKKYTTLWDWKKLETIEQEMNDIMKKIDKRKRRLRSPLNLDEKVLFLAERLRKKDTPGNLY